VESTAKVIVINVTCTVWTWLECQGNVGEFYIGGLVGTLLVFVWLMFGVNSSCVVCWLLVMC